tara:strand:+ start:37168 stop:37314 length:147 start_codon:yes stop_codon:yes gene_type:complete
MKFTLNWSRFFTLLFILIFITGFLIVILEINNVFDEANLELIPSKGTL